MKRKLLLAIALLWASHTLATTTTQTPTKPKSQVEQVKTASAKQTTNKTKSKTTATHKTHHVSHHTRSTKVSKHKTKSHTATKSPASTATADTDSQVNGLTSTSTTALTSSNWTQKLADFAHQTVDNLRYSSYRYGGTRFDVQRGIYQLDCSHYVDNLLNQTNPNAYYTLAHSTGSPHPSSEHYYKFFNRLSAEPSSEWHKIEDSQQLQTGDILVFRYLSSRGRSAGGHVMVVMNKSVLKQDVVAVQVADSASAGHSQDTRGPRKSGVGIGTLLLKVDARTGQPYAYAWRTDAPWKQNVSIAMGRPASSLTT